MGNLLANTNSATLLVLLFAFILLRYLFISGIFYFIFYKWFKTQFLRFKIQEKFPSKSDFKREISYSLLTVLIFTVATFAALNKDVIPYTQVYFDIEKFGLAYFFLSVFLIIFLHDTYFYWVHRLLHSNNFFRKIHLIHHKSTNPTAWTAFSFHPLEAILNTLYFTLFMFLIPAHIYTLGIFALFMFIYNAYGHNGYDIAPKGFNKSWFGSIFVSSLNHNIHHKKYKYNYGLYFTFWDKLMKTNYSKFDEEFNQLKSRK